ncbi:hypothetical protein K469DRAFT_581796 [Zopfia rhizophila CBS 207.26]|uniref:Rhodopsin domain-containing protein n=1 Tax=Zopfia rhizophila CBS 207.26 TaxID=1314779 RepID=A0A6A6E189_9PEZI|nr:hypothetical protein K469DRAFT_581796 [Zopfia rhizophila CBS 207.26]
MMYLFPRQDAPPTMAPPGVTPNYVNPESIGGKITWSGPFLCGLALAFVILRSLIKTLIIKKWSWDDTFIVIAWFFALGRVIMNVYMVEVFMVGRHTWDIPPWELIRVGNGSKNGLFIGDMLYFWGIMFTKLSILALYLNVFKIYRPFRFLCYGMMAFVVTYLLVFFFIYAFDCNPVAKGWHLIGWTGPPGTCIDIIDVGYAVGAINIFTDVVILVMPLPLLAKLHLDNARKLGLMAIFATGIGILTRGSVVACTIIREVVIVRTFKDLDQNWSTVEGIIWLTAELCVGIICACLPSLAPIYTRKMMSSLIPESLRDYLRSMRSSFGSRNSSNKSGVSKKSFMKNSQKLDDSASDIELVDGGASKTYVSVADMGEKDSSGEGIHQTTNINIKYSQNKNSNMV